MASRGCRRRANERYLDGQSVRRARADAQQPRVVLSFIRRCALARRTGSFANALLHEALRRFATAARRCLEPPHVT